MKKIKMAVIGYGQRGSSLTKAALHNVPEIEVVAVCDLYEDRVARGVALNEEKYQKTVSVKQAFSNVTFSTFIFINN